MPDPSILEIWAFLRTEVDARNRRLASVYESAFADLAETIRSLETAVRNEELPHAPAGQFQSIRDLVQGPGRRLFWDPIRSCRKARPLERVLEALEGHDTGLDDLIRRLPRVIIVSGPELLEAIGSEVTSRFRKYLLGRRDRLELPLRAIAELHFLEQSKARAELDGACCLLLAQCSLLLLSPWQDLRRLTLRRLAGQGVDDRAWTRCRTRWLARATELKNLGGQRIPELRAWTEGAAARLANAVFLGRGLDSSVHGNDLLTQCQWNFRYWSRQQRAVTSLTDLEWELTHMLEETAGTASDTLCAIETEQRELIGELDFVIAWLGQSQDGDIQGEFPPPVAQLVSAEDRIGAWTRLVELSADAHLPLRVESVEPRHALPRRREPWRQLEPHHQLLSAMSRVGRPLVREGFREVEGAHRAIVRVIERAREVVGFSVEAAQSEPDESSTVVREGISNALALASYQKNTAADPRASAEAKLVEGLANAFLLTHVGLEQRRLGLLTQLVRQSGSRVAREAWKVVLQQSGQAGRWVRDRTESRYHWLLIKVGWEASPFAVLAPITSRPYLGDVLNLQLGARDLPMIYRRLFRLAPVEEPRFLVGRDSEMAALGHARSLWQANRTVSVILVGNRGSGKTSLLNCAVAREFSADAVIRSQFSERVTTAGQMRTFLRHLFQIPEGQDLVEGLAGQKRVVMLEELERTFVRRVNGFEGLAELLSIISGSSRNTLWILCVNEHSFRYLDSVQGLGQNFSHRINAMAIPPAHLRSAILLRHNLSGLRLQYPAVPETAGTLHAVQHLFGLEPNAEDLFFDSLYRQSEGIFRSAFELWQHFMERVEGGVLYLKQPAEPDYEPLIAQFTQADLFSLQAILQHGSLTDRDHAEVFDCSPQMSKIQLEKLLSLECLEPDPAGPGLRIRPEAGRLIHMALHRHNLL